MASYYYLISSLPDIRADGEMPCTYEAFLNRCESNVSEKKYNALKNLTLFSAEGPLLSEWGKFNNNLMGELNARRSAGLGRPYTREYDKDLENSRIAQDALQAKNPLEAEIMLLRHQFEAVDTLIGQHAYDDIALFGYAVKLKLLERQSCFVREKGQRAFNGLLETVRHNIAELMTE